MRINFILHIDNFFTCVFKKSMRYLVINLSVCINIFNQSIHYFVDCGGLHNRGISSETAQNDIAKTNLL